jgi:hypothetical protein
MFCGHSLAPTKNYLPLAYEQAKGSTVGLGKLFLGEVYRYLHLMSLSFRYLHLMSLSLLTQKKLRTGGPWWFIQLWAHLYFQDFIPNFSVLANNSFPDQSGRRIRCTSFGQALYSLFGSKLNPSAASNWLGFSIEVWTTLSSFPILILKFSRTQSPLDWLILPMMIALGIYILS